MVVDIGKEVKVGGRREKEAPPSEGRRVEKAVTT
jgi:hypothetical protein